MIGGFPGDTPYILLSTPEAVAGYAATLKEPIRIVEKQGAATSTLVQSRRFIALDIETWAPGEAKTVRKFLHRGSKKACPALDWQVARIRLISLYEPGAPKPVVIDLGQELSPAMRQALAQLLEILGELTIYGHNLVFDLAFLKHEFGFCPKNVFDTMVAVKLLENDDLAEVYSLAGGHYEPNPEDYHASLVGALGHYLGLELDNELGGGAKSDFGAPSLSGDQYLCSANDARHLPKLVGALEKELYAAGLDTISRLEMELISWAARAEVAGVPADADAFDAAIRSLAQAQADFAPRIEAAMKESGFDPARFYQSKRKTDPLTLNINSTSLKRAFFAHTGITLPLTEKGNHSFSAEAFEEIDHPVARLYLGYDAARARGIALKQRRKHIWPKSGRIHPTFHTLGANSGRIISSDPNMQNVPREAEARAMFQARPGFVFVHGDLSKIELRCMAHFSNDERLIEIFNGDPKDPANDVYAVIGSQITGVPVADIARNHDLEGYFIGKRTVLSYPYGMQPPEFVARNRKPDGSRFTLDEAIEFRRAFFATFPGLAAWIEEAWEMVRMGDVNEGRTSWGRRRLICPLIPGTRNNLAWRTFQSQINFKVQGACADGLKRSIVDNLMNRAWQLGTLDPHPIGCLYVAKETSEKPGFPDATNAIAHQSAL